MGIRLNLQCNGALRGDAHRNWEEKFDKVAWPEAPKRDVFGIKIEEEDDAYISE